MLVPAIAFSWWLASVPMGKAPAIEPPSIAAAPARTVASSPVVTTATDERMGRETREREDDPAPEPGDETNERTLYRGLITPAIAASTPAIGPDLAHATDDQLRVAIEQAELPALMPALGYLTGDLSLVGDELRPPASGSSVVLAAQGGMTPAQQELARQRALDALIAFRDGGCVPAAPPTRLADRRALMTFMTSEVDDRYLPMLAFELGLPD